MIWGSGGLLEVGLTKVIPAILINKLIFFIGYKISGNASIVDTAWTVSHFVAGAMYYWHFEAYNHASGNIMLGILFAWTARLSYHLFVYRILRG